MPNPYLPLWEYIPDGEPRVFGNRVYVYGSHDRVGHDQFCDYVLKCWSAPVDDLGHWTDHGVIFRTRDTFDHPADTDWTKEHNELYAPDVVEKDGKYYLFAYIIGAKGCVAVSDRPEGPFTLLGRYKYTIPDSVCVNGWFIDPGVLVDDDGQVYIACGFERSFIAKIDPQDMTHVLDDTYLEHIIPCKVTENGGFTDPDSRFYEAASLRKSGIPTTSFIPPSAAAALPTPRPTSRWDHTPTAATSSITAWITRQATTTGLSAASGISGTSSITA